MKRFAFFFLACSIFLTHLLTIFAVAADWPTNLVWSGGGLWTKRLPVSVENIAKTPFLGKPVAVKIPPSIQQNIQQNTQQNISAKELRVTKSDGTELVYGLTPDGTTLLIPVEADPGRKAEFFVYFGNEKAETVPDMLDAKPGLLNGDVETGEGRCPEGWFMDADTPTSQNSWVEAVPNSGPKSGKKCLKTAVEKGTASSWTATRQGGIPVVGGAKYRFKAWVRGESVEGRAGWFLHVGNEKNSQLVNQVIGDGKGTFDWKEISSEFTAPIEAESMMIGTVLYGTGTAWFDAASVERIDTDNTATAEPTIIVGDVEDIPFNIIPAETAWPDFEKPESVKPEYRLNNGTNYLCRSTFRIVNASDKAMDGVPVLLTLRGTQAHGLLGPLTDLKLDDGSPVIMLDAENFRATCNISIPAKTAKYFNVYYRFNETKIPTGLSQQQAVAGESDTAHPELQKAVDPFVGLASLVKNGDFETGFSLPDDWNRNDVNPQEGVRYSLEKAPEIVRFGKQCLRLDVEKHAPNSWRGWTQRIEIEPNHTYLVQGWMKGIDLETARIHLHFHTADGKHCVNGGMSSINQDISGTTDWTRVAEVVTTPPDAKFMTLHLTMNGHGTLLHDNIIVVDGLFAEQVDRESFLKFSKNSNQEPGPVVPTLKNRQINLLPSEAEPVIPVPPTTPLVWQVPAVMKVFPQTISTKIPPTPQATPDEPAGFGIEAARNEKEPLQLAIRSETARKLKIKISPARLERGDPSTPSLNRFEINTVGYVRIDYPSNYYNTKTPKWYRKSPTSAPGCDGWGGLWPDPLLPNDTLNLKPNQTESAWITWSIPKDTPPGSYLANFELWEGDNRVYDRLVGIKVRDFTLPDENHVSAIYDVRFGPGGRKYWGGDEKSFEKEVIEFMTANRLAPDSIMPSPPLSFKDGKPVFDWTEFDKTADWYFNERKVRQVYTPMFLYSFGWGHPPKDFFGEKPYPGDWPFKGADFSQIRPEYRLKYQSVLREFWNHVKEKGWAEKFILYVSDEPNYWTPEIITQMKAVCDMIHEVDPKIPIYSSTWRYVPEWSQSLNVWGIGHYGIVPVDTMKQIKADGSRIWFTTDGMLCLDTPYSAIERLLPYYCFRYGADAYEFWGVAWLTYDPYEYGSHAYIYQTSTPGEYYWVRYPNGDGYLLYPGTCRPGEQELPLRRENPLPLVAGAKERNIVSSVRFEQAREGVEDFEYFYLLTQLIDQAKKTGKDVSKAEAALEQARNMVECPSPIGRYSSKILPNPYRIYEVRRQVAEAIESLNKDR